MARSNPGAPPGAHVLGPVGNSYRLVDLNMTMQAALRMSNRRDLGSVTAPPDPIHWRGKRIAAALTVTRALAYPI